MEPEPGEPCSSCGQPMTTVEEAEHWKLERCDHPDCSNHDEALSVSNEYIAEHGHNVGFFIAAHKPFEDTGTWVKPKG